MATTKQVLVVRKDLKMRKGKIASQTAHAAMMIFLQKAVIQNGVFQCLVTPVEEEWFADSFTKVCVSVNSEEELESVYYKALDAGLPSALCVDNGTTEFGGVPTKTVVAVGPDYSEKIDEITGGLPLL